MGALLLSLYLRRAGHQAHYLGGNLPIDDILKEVSEKRPKMLLLSAGSPNAAAELQELTARMKQIRSRTDCDWLWWDASLTRNRSSATTSPAFFSEKRHKAQSTSSTICLRQIVSTPGAPMVSSHPLEVANRADTPIMPRLSPDLEETQDFAAELDAVRDLLQQSSDTLGMPLAKLVQEQIERSAPAIRAGVVLAVAVDEDESVQLREQRINLAAALGDPLCGAQCT